MTSSEEYYWMQRYRILEGEKDQEYMTSVILSHVIVYNVGLEMAFPFLLLCPVFQPI